MRKAFIITSAVLIGILFALLVGELVSRLYYYSKKYPKIIRSQGIERKVKDPIEKEEKTLRIAFLGDSYTYGFGIKVKDTFPAVAQRILSQKIKDRRIQCLNFARKGANTEKELEILKEKILPYQPDVIVLGFVLNDFSYKERQARVNKLYRKDRKKYRPFQKLEKISKLMFYIDQFIFGKFSSSGQIQIDELNSLFDPAQNERFDEMHTMLTEILKILSNSKGMVLFFPHFIKNEEKLFFYQQGKRIVAGLCRQFNLDFIEILPHLKHKPFYKWWLHPVDHHPNGEAHAIIGGLVAQQILKNNEMPD